MLVLRDTLVVIKTWKHLRSIPYPQENISKTLNIFAPNCSLAVEQKQGRENFSVTNFILFSSNVNSSTSKSYFQASLNNWITKENAYNFVFCLCFMYQEIWRKTLHNEGAQEYANKQTLLVFPPQTLKGLSHLYTDSVFKPSFLSCTRETMHLDYLPFRWVGRPFINNLF